MLLDKITVILVPTGRTMLYVGRREPLPDRFPPWVGYESEALPPSPPQFHTDAIELRPFSDGARVVHAALHDGVLYVSNNVRYADLCTVYTYVSVGAPTEAAHQYHVRNLSGQPMYWCAFCEEWYRLLVDERPSCGCGHRKLVYRYQT